MNVKNDADRLVEDYLRRLAEAADPLPAGRRTELMGEVTAHIAQARAEGAASEGEVRAMLTRLGSPAEIVAAATDGLVLVDRFRSRDVAALLFLACGGFLLTHYVPIDMPGWLAWPGWIAIVVSQTAILALLFQNARPGRSNLG